MTASRIGFARLARWCVLLGFVGCNAADSSEATQPATNRLSDGEIAHIVRTLNSGQIDQAEVALLRLSHRDDRTFAQQTIADHMTSNSAVSELLQKPGLEPEDNSISIELKSESDRTLVTLQEANDDLIDLAYIDAQVTAYGKLVALYDHQLLADVRDPELRVFLQTDRDRVSKNLADAQALDSELSP